MKHTKLPWTTDGSINGYTCIRSDEKEHAVAWADFEDKDDLAYALMACNNHERLVEALSTGAQVNLPDFLDWLAERMVKVYGESPNIDFVLTCRERAKLCRAALDACEVG